MPQRILVVDDDKQIARLIRSYLEQAGYQVVVAYDGETALHALRRESPDLVVLDLMLPDRDGWDVTRTVRSDPALAATPIIMVTARVEDTDKIIGLELGADDYVTKPFNPRELVSRVRAILRRTSGQPVLATTVLESGALRLDPDQHEARLDGQPLDLTPTEFDLLRTLMENQGHAFTRAELIEQALGYTYDGLDRTVDSHIKNLRRKIEVDPANPIYIQTVYGVGYRFAGAHR
ncbi:MAG: response regulator transcription factor [Anaerolineales bacterium]|nr:response regulator transcription factor [Anaerolineales bacterium]MCO5242923.1 response regulator transcription factor [Anaerolineae bacterium]HRX04401.1 response regulator transcription factor [Anaerolineae bacterium]